MAISPDWALVFVFPIRIYTMCCLLSLCISEKSLWLKAAINPSLILLPLQLSKESSPRFSPPCLASTALSPAHSRIYLPRVGNRRLLTELRFKYPWPGSCLCLWHVKCFSTSLKINPCEINQSFFLWLCWTSLGWCLCYHPFLPDPGQCRKHF